MLLSMPGHSQPWWRAPDAPVTYLGDEDERSIAAKDQRARLESLLIR
ncbi:hypothetical protein KW843_11605 [Acidovorax sp. sif1233]|nr:hypothetical protein [Acidovorax sp. sif1233]MBV7455116.1 hypothetical protein [Acidovorax sp. sif1233]